MLNVKLFLTSEKILDEASDEFAEGSGGTYLLFGFLLGVGLWFRIGLGFGLYYRLWFGLAIGDFERWLVVVGRSRLWRCDGTSDRSRTWRLDHRGYFGCLTVLGAEREERQEVGEMGFAVAAQQGGHVRSTHFDLRDGKATQQESGDAILIGSTTSEDTACFELVLEA